MKEQTDALELVFARNAFYKRMHYLALSALTLSLFVLGFLIWMVIYLANNPTRPLYFATDSIGRLINIIPINTPNMPIENVIAWTVEGVQKAFSYDFINFRDQFQAAQKYFTPYGWQNYMNALQSTPNWVGLKANKWIVTAQVVSPPKMLTQGILANAYAWKFEMPILVTYWSPPYDNKSKFSNALNVTVIVQRQEILQSYKGLGILQIIATSAARGIEQPQEISNKPTT